MSTAYSSAKQQYIGNGVTTEWGFDFPIQKHSELKVYLKRSVSQQVLLEEGVDYSFVTENTIAFPIKTGEAKLQATDVLALQRESVFESEYNFSNQQRLEPEEVMHADDNLERQIQELKRDVTQAIRIQPTSNIDTDEYFIAVESIYENLDNITNVSGISAEIVNCSDNISDISTVSSNISNVNAVGQSISNVNTVASNVSSVNTVAGVSTDVTAVANVASSVPTVANNDANITTVATNISDVNTAATNIEAIKAAPTAASNAAQSAANAANSATISANSAIWAEGTDAQVQALGGVHSSKVWAQQSTNANIALTNSPYTTNRILEIPQDIKLELNNGTLTLKAGSKVYVPNGPGVFDEVVIQNDVSSSNPVIIRESSTIVYRNNSLSIYLKKDTFSGATQPTPSGNNAVWYDTANNYVKYTNDKGANWKIAQISLPVCLASSTATEWTSIDQVFNGFGYIGSTVFALPGIKCQFADGRNEDGSYKSYIKTTDKVLTQTFGAETFNSFDCSLFCGNDTIDGLVYHVNEDFDNKSGYIIINKTEGIVKNLCPVFRFFINSSTGNGKISQFIPNPVDKLNWKSTELSGMSMPSNKYIDLTLGASGSTYTAPANGWLILNKIATSVGQEIRLTNQSNQLRGYAIAAITSAALDTMIPCRKGDTIYIYYSAAGSVEDFRFVYAEGEN